MDSVRSGPEMLASNRTVKKASILDLPAATRVQAQKTEVFQPASCVKRNPTLLRGEESCIEREQRDVLWGQ